MAEAHISITVNGEAKEVEASQTGVELFADDKNIIAVRLNGELRDLYTPLHDGDNVESVTLDSPDGTGIMRHSATHVMAQAVQEVRPDAKLGIGPVIENGFYYDFDVKDPFTPDGLKTIEKHMQRIIKSAQRFQRRVVSEEEALREEADEPYKIELIKDKEDALETEAAVDISHKELSMYDDISTVRAMWCGRISAVGTAPAEHPLYQGIQAGARRRRVLEGFGGEPHAPAHLRRGVPHQGRAQGLPDPHGGGRQTRPPQTRVGKCELFFVP